ncbi:tetraacyldisaccharide 4'-kinase [Pelistega sp. MC2]|uniref:tetraacyldisaccharide 4'-kinase n=1 Tax=Pelistega sp. MC2 TaxID=1720297 RepID=UPI000AFDA15C|nr:tetraacyldisaccharide 4'-kinase [Pelistega sp. MC2]
MLSSVIQYIQQQWLKKGLFSIALSPIARLVKWHTDKKYTSFTHQQFQRYRAPVPVIIVGNIFIGGTGKTPVSIALIQALKQRGFTPGVISRGYGADIKHEAICAYLPNASSTSGDKVPVTQHIIAPAEESTLTETSPSAPIKWAEKIGDEPSILAQYAPVAVHPRRQKAIELLLKTYPTVDILISDDGLQHYAIDRDIEIIVQDTRGIGNGYLLPAGPLRESPSRLNTVNYVVTNYNTREQALSAQLSPPKNTESHDSQSTLDETQVPEQIGMYLTLAEFEHLLTGKIYTITEFIQQHQQQNIYAISGIGHPERFYQSLRNQGVPLNGTKDFPDHHDYSVQDLVPFNHAIVVMTTKDAIKCRHFSQNNWWCVHTKAEFIPSTFFDHLEDKIKHLPIFLKKNLILGKLYESRLSKKTAMSCNQKTNGI